MSTAARSHLGAGREGAVHAQPRDSAVGEDGDAHVRSHACRELAGLHAEVVARVRRELEARQQWPARRGRRRQELSADVTRGALPPFWLRRGKPLLHFDILYYKRMLSHASTSDLRGKSTEVLFCVV